jgi:hypothetical protein
MKYIVLLFAGAVVFLNLAGQPPKIKPTERPKPTSTVASTAPSKIKYSILLEKVYTTNSWDGGDDYTEELYGAISVCLAANGYPAPVQLAYTYKNDVNKEINGGVEPSPQSMNPNGRVLWRQTDGKGDRKIYLNSRSKDITKKNAFLGTSSVFIFDTRQDPEAAFRFFADLWESDPSDDDEHFNAGRNRVSIPISWIKPGKDYTFKIEIFDSSSRHYALITIKAEAVQ